jgi:RNA polymerase sigma factor (sigma-70 family)
MVEHKWMILTLLKRYKATADMIGNTACEDLVQEGWLAIVRKIDGYDSTKGKLSTYMFPWIEDAFRQYLRKSSTVRKKRGKAQLKLTEYMLESVEYDEFRTGSIIDSPEDINNGMQQAKIAVDTYLERTKRNRPSQKRNEIQKLQVV